MIRVRLYTWYLNRQPGTKVTVSRYGKYGAAEAKGTLYNCRIGVCEASNPRLLLLTLKVLVREAKREAR